MSLPLPPTQHRHAGPAGAAASAGICRDCTSFSASAAALEQAFPGLAAMGSGFGSVRWGDGLCALHERYLSCASGCDRFSARQ